MAHIWKTDAPPLCVFRKQLNAFRNCEAGATAIEYGLIVSLIFLAVVSGVRAFTNSTSEMYGEIESARSNWKTAAYDAPLIASFNDIWADPGLSGFCWLAWGAHPVR